MRFAFILMGAFDAERDRAAIGGGAAEIAGVSNLEEACAAAKRLCASGVGCIELCGAFGPAGARAVIEATGNRIPVGYVTHLPEQDDLYARAFPEKGCAPPHRDAGVPSCAARSGWRARRARGENSRAFYGAPGGAAMHGGGAGCVK